MAISPFIRPIRTSGGTFYSFSSTAEDLGFSFNNDRNKFRFSKYVLLNIPDIKTPTALENYIQFDAIPGNFDIDGSKSTNVYLAESFQNYALNLETMITSANTYDPNIKRTVAERVFWKWIKEIGGVRFREANVTEVGGQAVGEHFVEEDDSETYKKVVQYIGDIDVVNSVRNLANAYSQVYIHLPTNHGAPPTILFTATNDANYSPGMAFKNVPLNPLNAEYIYGRNYDDTHPAALDFNAHFDSDSGSFATQGLFGTANFEYYDNTTLSWQAVTSNQWWFSLPDTNTYFLEPTYFTDTRNDRLRIDEPGTKTVEFLRSKLDGISVEFNEIAYKDIAANPDINSFGDYANSSLAKNFEFNAVLVYYDLFDPNVPDVKTTNLFGILFLDNVDPKSGGGGEIKRLQKVKPNPITGDNGNSYAFTLNLKFDVSAEDAAIETTVNDYSTFSLELYVDALNQLKEAARLLQESIATTATLTQNIQELQGIVLTTNTIAELSEQITNIENSLDASAQMFSNSESLQTLIDRNYQEILNIYNNLTSVDVAYNLNIIHSGSGIFIDRSTPGIITVNSTRQAFTLGNLPIVSIQSNFQVNTSSFSFEHILQEFDNYLRITDGSTGQPFVVDRDIIIYLKDYPVKWINGQKLRISFENGLDLSNTSGNFNLIIYTDSKDNLNTGFTYSTEAAVITYTEFELKGGKPIIEIICIDVATFTFVADIF